MSRINVTSLSNERNDETNEDDGEYENYGQENVYENYVENDQDGRTGSNASSTQNDVYENYDADYEAYRPRYGSYTKNTTSNRQIIMKRIARKKCLIIMVVSLVFIGGIIVGLSVHFTATSPSPSTALPSDFSIMTSIAPAVNSTLTSMVTLSEPFVQNLSNLIHSNS